MEFILKRNTGLFRYRKNDRREINPLNMMKMNAYGRVKTLNDITLASPLVIGAHTQPSSDVMKLRFRERLP